MANTIKNLAVRTEDGEVVSMPIGVDAENVDTGDGESLGEKIRQISTSVLSITSTDLPVETKQQYRSNIGAGTSSFSGDYGDLTNTPKIPSKVSDLENDSNFISSYVNTTYTLSQDKTDGHKLIFTPAGGADTIITIPDNDTTYGAGAGISISGSNKIGLKASGAQAGTYGPEADVNGTNGNAIVVPQLTVDEHGRITSITNRTYTSVDTNDNTTYSAATQNAPGLMSKDDKIKLDGITSSADSVTFSQSLTTGTAVGVLNINGTETTLFAPTPPSLSGYATQSWVEGKKYLTSHQSLSGYVPTTRTVNGHALSANVSVTKSDVGLGNVDNTADANKTVKYAISAGSANSVAAANVQSGTFKGAMVVPASTAYTTNQLRNIVFTTTDPGAGAATSYANGSLICVYE